MKARNVKRVYGYLCDPGDFRDFSFSIPSRMAALPERVDLRELMPPVYDQGRTGSCVAQSTAAAHWVCHKLQIGHTPGVLPMDPSRLFIYYEARHMEGMERWDRGCYIRDAIKVLVKKGVCPESDWPFVQNKVCSHPPRVCYAEAMTEQVVAYYRIPSSVLAMRQCLSDGYPFVIGVSLYESFESDAVKKTGVVPMPTKGESMVGGHAMLAVGYDALARTFTVRNSWGEDWGDKGYCYMPEEYLGNEHLCTDCWTLREVE